MNKNSNKKILGFYSFHSCITDPGENSSFLEGMPTDIPVLVAIVQGLILHLHWTEKYGVYPSDERRDEANLRTVSRQLEQINNHDSAPLNRARSLEKRILGTCRDFSVFLSGLLRHQGIPARARCGFGTYFTPGKYEDHWICEYWNSEAGGWVMIDAQLDELQCQVLGIDFDPLDIPPDRFLTAGEAWQICRTGDADPEKFGIFDMHGLWFIRGNLVREIASLNKVELLPWDCWGLINGGDDALSNDDFDLLDSAASLTLPATFSLPDLHSLYQTNPGLKVPPVISSLVGGTFQDIELKDVCG